MPPTFRMEFLCRGVPEVPCERLGHTHVERDEDGVGLLHALRHALDDRHRALEGASHRAHLVLEDEGAVGGDRQVLEAHVGGGRITARQGVVLEDQSRVPVDQHDPVRPGEGDVALLQDVEVRVADPVARRIQVVEVGAPDLLACGRVGLGHKGPDHVWVLGGRVLPADDVQLTRVAVIDVGDTGVIVGAPPGVDAVGVAARAEKARAGKEPAALAVGDLGAVQRRIKPGVGIFCWQASSFA
ncbi:MAG: hypothetical protein LJE70_04925 [Chromatiaceae bacterium]|nr:hypothetical protein [Chromatiaceae bacterium]